MVGVQFFTFERIFKRKKCDVIAARKKSVKSYTLPVDEYMTNEKANK